MKDDKIIEMLFERNEEGLREVEREYRGFCNTVASNILSMREDREECINDMLLALWNSIPPEKPDCLKSYIARIIRNLALKKSRDSYVWKRSANSLNIGDEFLECIPDTQDLCEQFEAARAGKIINDFLETLPENECDVFVLHYYYGEELLAIAEDMGYTEGKVKSMLFRIRKKLTEKLTKEGIIV
ncbi:MAG: sigma-70 family RNA polymerase sigma factor [Clostridia bacterium]|nr:sigma-70 family RNA polymerase sigma factor [Clostridia bacterium]